MRTMKTQGDPSTTDYAGLRRDSRSYSHREETCDFIGKTHARPSDAPPTFYEGRDSEAPSSEGKVEIIPKLGRKKREPTGVGRSREYANCGGHGGEPRPAGTGGNPGTRQAHRGTSGRVGPVVVLRGIPASELSNLEGRSGWWGSPVRLDPALWGGEGGKRKEACASAILAQAGSTCPSSSQYGQRID